MGVRVFAWWQQLHVAPWRGRRESGAGLLGNSAAGLTLLEVLFAISLLSVGLLAVAVAFPAGLSGVEQGKQQTTAVFLADQRLEQIKATDFSSITSANFPAEGIGTIANHPRFRRTVTITNSPGGVANTVRVDVNVFYRPVVSFGVLATERQVTVSTLIADR
jgi:type II secretory pathway pseudopilin PulG